MKKEKIDLTEPTQDDILPEYDFTGKKGTRGKYYQAYRKGHTVRIHQPNGMVNVQYFTLEDGAIMLEPDVRAYFPDSEAVNAALRSLIRLIPTKRRANSPSRGARIQQVNE
jgi:hypothetical protein